MSRASRINQSAPDLCDRVIQIQTLSNSNGENTRTVQIDSTQATLEDIDVAASLDACAASMAGGGPNSISYRSFIHAVNAGDGDLAEKLLDQGVDVNASDSNGRTALEVAVLIQSSEASNWMTSILLERGANPNTDDDIGMTLIMAVISNKGEFEDDETDACLHLLIQHRADVNKSDGLGRTPLAYAVIYDRPDYFCLLSENGASLEKSKITLALAPNAGDVDVVQTAIRLWVAGGGERMAETPLLPILRWAIASDERPLVKRLLASGQLSAAAITSPEGERPLHIAERNGDEEMVLLLLDHGVTVDLPEDLHSYRTKAMNGSALCVACKWSNVRSLQVLLERSASQLGRDHVSWDGILRSLLKSVITTRMKLQDPLDIVACLMTFARAISVDLDIVGTLYIRYPWVVADERCAKLYSWVAGQGLDVLDRRHGHTLLHLATYFELMPTCEVLIELAYSRQDFNYVDLLDAKGLSAWRIALADANNHRDTWSDTERMVPGKNYVTLLDRIDSWVMHPDPSVAWHV